MKRLTLFLLMTFLLAGCQSAPSTKPDASLFTPTGPIIAAIEQDFAAKRLTRPRGHNVMEKLNRMAAISPDDPLIAKYKTRVVRELVALGQAAFVAGKYDRSRILSVRVLEIQPGNKEAGYILDALREVAQQQSQEETIVIEEVAPAAGVDIQTIQIVPVGN